MRKPVSSHIKTKSSNSIPMKTLSQILREIFSTRDRSLSKSINQKQIQDETETHEISGDSGMGDPDAPKIDRNDQKPQESGDDTAESGNRSGSESGEAAEPGAEPGAARESGNESECGTTSEPVKAVEQKSLESSPEIEDKTSKENTRQEDFNKAIEEAYQRGLIDGRNAQIEEIYYPKEDDGIPVFRGKPSNYRSTGDFFSIAREA